MNRFHRRPVPMTAAQHPAVRWGRRAPLVAVLWTLLASAAVTADAQTRVFRIGAEDLTVRVNADWAGGREGGYYPLRLTLLNTGPSRQLVLRYRPRERHRLPVVQRTVDIAQNERRFVTLSIPLVGFGDTGTLEVLDNNDRVIEGLQQVIRLPQVDRASPETPSILLIARADVRSTEEIGVAAAALDSRIRSGPRYHPGRQRVSLDFQRVEPSSLPEMWINYTTVDLVLIALNELKRLPGVQRRALLRWVQCGGTVVVFLPDDDSDGRSPKPPRSAMSAIQMQAELDDLFKLNEGRAVSNTWANAPLKTRDAAAQRVAQNDDDLRLLQGRPSQPAALPEGEGDKRVVFHWPKSTEAFFQRDVFWGTVVAFPGDPFTGTRFDWAWLLHTLGTERYQWSSRHGFSARRDTEEFVEFLIPGVKGVPVYSFLILITAFTALIGPLNYFLLWKRKRLFLLVVTIPAIAFLTSLALFGYSSLAHGFAVKSRVRSVTILDQRRQESVSVSRVALFAGFPPSDGLRFSPDTAVFPIWPLDKQFETGTVDWTETQQLKAGWLPSRTRTQFLAISHRRERARLEIAHSPEGTLTVSNGLPWKIDSLLAADDDGNLFYLAAGLAPGETAELAPPTDADLQQFDTLLRQHPLEAPEGMTTPHRRRRRAFGLRFRSRRRGWPEWTPSYSQNLAERKIDRFRRIRTDQQVLAHRSYLAVLAESPDVDVGIEQTEASAGYHLLLGYY